MLRRDLKDILLRKSFKEGQRKHCEPKEGIDLAYFWKGKWASVANAERVSLGNLFRISTLSKGRKDMLRTGDFIQSDIRRYKPCTMSYTCHKR